MNKEKRHAKKVAKRKKNKVGYEAEKKVTKRRVQKQRTALTMTYKFHKLIDKMAREDEKKKLSRNPIPEPEMLLGGG